MKSIYLAHPLNGCSIDDIFTYYDNVKSALNENFNVLTPMYKYARVSQEERGDADDPIRCNHSIFKRDTWLVSQSDIVLCDFTGSDASSIGCSMELAVANWEHKHTVVVLPKNNIHNHAFIKEAADIIFEDIGDAVDYVNQLA